MTRLIFAIRANLCEAFIRLALKANPDGYCSSMTEAVLKANDGYLARREAIRSMVAEAQKLDLP